MVLSELVDTEKLDRPKVSTTFIKSCSCSLAEESGSSAKNNVLDEYNGRKFPRRDDPDMLANYMGDQRHLLNENRAKLHKK